MNTTLSFVKRTLIAGLLVLFPILLLAFLANKIWNWMRPLIRQTFADTGMGAALSWTLFAILVVLVSCFVAGLLVRYSQLGKAGHWIEKKLLVFLPGYEFYKAVMVELFPSAGQKDRCAIIARTGNSWQPGILIEETEEFCVVFIMLANNSLSGAIHVLPATEVKRLNTSILRLRKITSQMGDGLLETLPPRQTTVARPSKDKADLATSS